MSSSRSLQCILAISRSLRHTSPQSLASRNPHGISSRSLSSRPPKAEIQSTSSPSPTKSLPSAASLDPATVAPKYTAEERAALEKHYTPAQLASIDAGEASISAADLVQQGVIRNDPMRIRYLDDFSTIRPYIDKPLQAPEENYDPNLRYKTDEELETDMAEFALNQTKDIEPLELIRFYDNLRLTVGKEEAETNPRSYESPNLPTMTDPWIRATVKAAEESAGDESDSDQQFRQLSRRIGQPVRELKRLRVKILVTHRVVNQTRMGKVQSQYYLTVAGNGNGLVGIGEAKAVEAGNAMKQSKMNAIRNLQPIPRYEERTIFGDVKGKVGATELQLMTRPPGFGIRCQDKIYEICKCAGISDLAARVTRSRNAMNTVKATIQALLSQRIPEDIARARGRKLVDVRKVYYSGIV